MKRALWAIFGVLLIAGLTYYVMTHPNLDKVDHLRAELDKLQDENRELAGQNKALEEEIQALRDDPRLAERRAREAAGLARPTEVIYQFEEPDRPIEVGVKMVVTTDGIELAGKEVTVDDLPDALAELRRQLPGAKVDVDVKDGVDPIRRQGIMDVVEASQKKD
jgi:cell division protein FtsB